MDRRHFLNKTAVATAATVAGTALIAEETKSEKKKKGCKITVLKCTLQKDLIGDKPIKPCKVMKEGQEFMVTSPWQKPEGFCDWAWGDIRTYIHRVYGGQKDEMVGCCTDGNRPVFFRLEHV